MSVMRIFAICWFLTAWPVFAQPVLGDPERDSLTDLPANALGFVPEMRTGPDTHWSSFEATYFALDCVGPSVAARIETRTEHSTVGEWRTKVVLIVEPLESVPAEETVISLSDWFPNLRAAHPAGYSCRPFTVRLVLERAAEAYPEGAVNTEPRVVAHQFNAVAISLIPLVDAETGWGVGGIALDRPEAAVRAGRLALDNEEGDCSTRVWPCDKAERLSLLRAQLVARGYAERLNGPLLGWVIGRSTAPEAPF